MFVAEVFQYGQGQQGQSGLFALFQQYFLLLVLLIVVPLIIIAYRLLFPNLNVIRATRPLIPKVETQRAREGTDPHRFPEQHTVNASKSVELTLMSWHALRLLAELRPYRLVRVAGDQLNRSGHGD